MSKERLVGLAALGLTAYELSKLSFARGARKEIGKRDKWTCQGINGDPCLIASLDGGKPADWKSGFMLTAAHYPDKHNGNKDTNPDNGRILCVMDHALEEYDRGNRWGSNKLLEMGVYHVKHARKTKTQWYPTVEEVLELRKRVKKQ